MSDTIKTSPRQKKVDRYLRAANIGTAATILTFLFYLPIGGDDTQWIEEASLPLIFAIAIGVLGIVACETFAVCYVFLRRKTDEYTLAMWHSGATFAFFAAIIWLVFAPWIEATFVGIETYKLSSANPDADFDHHDITKEWGFENGVVSTLATPIILTAFFIGVQIKRLRGDL